MFVLKGPNRVNQGNLLNQPEIDWRTGEFYPVINKAEMWDFGEYNVDFYNTEIARRAGLLVQSIGKAVESDGHLLAGDFEAVTCATSSIAGMRGGIPT